MELNDAYLLANVLNEKINDGTLDKEILNNIAINVNVSPSILYGIDKEFYRISHDDSTEGFKHTAKVMARIDNVHFEFSSKETQAM